MGVQWKTAFPAWMVATAMFVDSSGHGTDAAVFHNGMPIACPASGSALIQLKPELSKTFSLEAKDDGLDVGEYQPVVVQKRMPGAGAGTGGGPPGMDCPHARAGLKSFSDFISEHSAGADVTLPGNGAFLLDASATLGGLTIPAGAELIFADAPNLTLTVSAVHVHGKLLLGGSEACALRSSGIGITLTGSGDQDAKSNDPLRTKGITVGFGGILEMFGVRYAPTWTRLASSVAPGSMTLELEDEVDWQVGQQVLVVTTAWADEPGNHQNEVRRLAAVSGKTLTLDSSLSYGHYGGLEYSAEVALLSRSITLQGDEQSEQTRFGGHLVCKLGSECRIGGVAAVRMGQENIMGRYPFHLHMMGDVSGKSFFQDSLVYHSFFRAYTVHGTSGARVSRNVAYDISGSAYYLEDGIEEDNVFDFNLAAFVHIIKRLTDYEAGGGQAGVTVASESTRIVPTDATAVGFYCTNARNRWVGNSASGGFSGFHFPTVPNALGDSYQSNPDYKPEEKELLEFDSNTAHSSGRIWSRGACMYVGGKLWEEAKGNHQYRYQTGRASPARKSGRFIFTNTKVFACRMGMLFWGTHWTARKPDLALERFEAHDVARSSSQLGNTYMFHAVISAHTGNTWAADLPKVAQGFELYDTDMQTILADVAFRNFDRAGDVAIMDMTHSNIFKQQGMFHSKNLRFDGTPHKQRFRHVHRLACKSYHQDTCKNKCSACPGTAGSSQISSIIDMDGTSLSWNRGGAILGADDASAETAGRTNEWWHIDDTCVHENDWGFWACPMLDHRTVVSLFIVKGLLSSSPARITPSTAVGMLYHFGHTDRHLDVGLAESPMVSGPCCDIGWYLALDGGAQAQLTIFMDQMVTQGGLVFGTAYPIGATFTIQRCLPQCTEVRKGSSLQEVLDAPGTVYFVDGLGRLFLKFLFEGNGFFTAAGIKQLQNGNRYLGGQGARYTIHSSKVGNVAFAVPDALPSGIGGPTQPPATTATPPASTAAPPATTTIPPATTAAPSPTPSTPLCKELHQGCLSERCCKGDGIQCYEKNAFYAQCKPSCTPGISPLDPPQYQTPWSCRVLTTGASTSTATTTMRATTTTTTTTTTITTTTMTKTESTTQDCKELFQGCLSERCCKGDGVQCYEKDAYYAQCRRSCTPGINPNDPKPTPWICRVLTKGPSTTKATTRTSTTVTTSTTTSAETKLTTQAPAPAPSSCMGKWGNCKNTKCCRNSGWKCFKKDRWYSQCRKSCPSSWNCKVLGL
mmetsp:Transcript_139134/g.432904  ORF Transcript_139134/g.432904 Transcript_139134/m.432904 type:complete len:1252 (-) Transcript_139134:508-4263(-)